MGKSSRKGVGPQKNALKVSPELFHELKDLVSSVIDENFHEVPNPKPEEIVVSKRPPSLKEQIQRLIKVELSQQMEQQGMETFEEANDFDLEDEGEFISPYEIHDMVEEVPINPSPSPPNNEPEEAPTPEEPQETPPGEGERD